MDVHEPLPTHSEAHDYVYSRTPKPPTMTYELVGYLRFATTSLEFIDRAEGVLLCLSMKMAAVHRLAL